MFDYEKRIIGACVHVERFVVRLSEGKVGRQRFLGWF